VRDRNFNLHAYLAGGGATLALIAAAVLVFASLGAYVAFEGLPIGDDGEDAAQVAVEASNGAAGARSSGGSQGDADSGEPGASAAAGGGGDRADAGPGAGDAVDTGVSTAPATAPDQPAAVPGAATPAVEAAPESNGVEPASGQDGTRGSVSDATAPVQDTVGGVPGVPTGELPANIPTPLGGAGGVGDVGGG